ncbi:DUF6011 domain-containing protein [Parafrankia elaeagni]|uniref:DUF6011 domain-containing protein n=1 Tax=Parafrankia elaeagni TaxID=222534 RepID=UPI000360C540|nr:DUF6011 domain-containing protein [Parafrankia elaeagni]
MTTTISEPAVCRRCGRPLTDPRSRALGLGSGCATHLRPAALEVLADAAAAATAQLTLTYADKDDE